MKAKHVLEHMGRRPCLLLGGGTPRLCHLPPTRAVATAPTAQQMSSPCKPERGVFFISLDLISRSISVLDPPPPVGPGAPPPTPVDSVQPPSDGTFENFLSLSFTSLFSPLSRNRRAVLFRLPLEQRHQSSLKVLTETLKRGHGENKRERSGTANGDEELGSLEEEAGCTWEKLLMIIEGQAMQKVVGMETTSTRGPRFLRLIQGGFVPMETTHTDESGFFFLCQCHVIRLRKPTFHQLTHSCFLSSSRSPPAPPPAPFRAAQKRRNVGVRGNERSDLLRPLMHAHVCGAAVAPEHAAELK